MARESIFVNIKNWYYTRKEEKYFKRKCNEADNQFQLTGKRHFVIPFGEQELIVVNNHWLKIYNKKVGTGQRRTYKQLIESAYYATKAGNLHRERMPLQK